MHDSVELRALLRGIIAEQRISHVVETGTHEGLGSTRFIAESFPPDMAPRSFLTIEASWRSWRRALRNLRRYRFVQPVWGQTVNVADAIRFVRDDECLRQHERYPDVFIDDVDDPVGFYTREILGGLAGEPTIWRQRLVMKLDRLFYYRGEALLARALARVRDENPLIVLDSAGGVGWLEFGVTREAMAERPYVILLDDVHHVKHFRSLAHIRTDPSFEIIGLDERHGWLLARHR